MRRCRMPFERLVDYREGHADAATVAEVRAHLGQGCAACEATLARLERTVSALRAGDLLHAPGSALERARALYRERFRAPVRPTLLARLVFDSRVNLAFAGARGGEEQAFQRLYSTDAHDIDLWQERTEMGGWYLIGQTLPKAGGEACSLVSATLTAADGRALDARIEAGEFHFPSVPPGVYQLTLRLPEPEREIIVPDVEVGA